MVLQIFHLIVEQHACRVHTLQIKRYVRQRVGLHHHVGLNATAVAHLTSCRCVEDVCERVGHMLCVSTLRVLIVDGLYASSARNVIFCCCELQLSVIRQRHVRHLHQTLSVGSCSEHHGAVKVLQRSTRDLACACCLSVHHHHDGHDRVYRLHRCCERLVGTLYLTLHREQRLALGQEHVQDRDGVLHVASAVASEVDDELLCTLLLEVEEGAAEIFRRAVDKLGVVDVANVARLQAIIGQVRHLNGLTRDLHRELLARSGAQHFQFERCAGIAAQVVADILVRLLCHVLAVDAEDDVALAQSSLGSRHALIGFVYHHALQLEVVAYDRSHAGILARHHLLILCLLVFRIVGGVRVQTVEHGIDSCAHHIGGVERVHIHEIEILVYGVEHVHAFCHIKVVVFAVLRPQGQREEHRCEQKKFSHIFYLCFLFYFFTFYLFTFKTIFHFSFFTFPLNRRQPFLPFYFFTFLPLNLSSAKVI